MIYMDNKERLRHFFMKQAMYIRLLIIDVLENLVNTDVDIQEAFHLDGLGHSIILSMNSVQFFIFLSLIKEQLYLILSCILAYKKRDIEDITDTKTKLLTHAIVMGKFLCSLGSSYTCDELIHICQQQNQYVIHIIEAQAQKQPARVSILFNDYYDCMIYFAHVIYTIRS
jgi:hypothetical protein